MNFVKNKIRHIYLCRVNLFKRNNSIQMVWLETSAFVFKSATERGLYTAELWH